MKKFLIILFLNILLIPQFRGQEIIEIKPLFDYPVAPEELVGLEERCEYIVKHFWDNFDFKNKKPLDQYALNEAFGVFVTPMQYSSKKEVDQAIDKLLNKLSSNPSLLFQFTKSAEEKLYGPRADIWIDEIYVKFLNSLIKNKKIPDARKTRYKDQLNALTNSKVGNTAPSFNFIDSDNEQKNYFPMSTPTILIFGKPDDTDWRLIRLKMDSNFKLGDAIEKGKINVIYIVTEGSENWQQEVANYNQRWAIGQSNEIKDKYDTRLNPAVFLVGSDGIILKKLITVEEAVDSALQLLN